ncbi:RNA polymerase sigma factor [Patescibacteria group bacterium]|nr:RNA polymerase sigma factor [Patescibacteria group bacterium]MBU2220575.1 RNA polymerase sigma factor [Patescibacteria group bacterium]
MIQDSMREVNSHLESWNDASDAAVLAASQKDPEVFAVLVARHEDAFMRKARSILHSTEDAEEVVQDTFTRIYVYADRYEPQEGASFTSWAYAILTRLAFTRYQKLVKHRGRTLALEPETYERLPEEGTFLDTLSIQNEVAIALAKLPEQAARVLRLQFLEGKTQDEIAHSEGSTIPAIKTRVHRAKKLLKKALEENQQTHER